MNKNKERHRAEQQDFPGRFRAPSETCSQALRFWGLLFPEPRRDLFLALAPSHRGPWRWLPAVPELLAEATAEIVAEGPGGRGECFYRLGLTAENPEGNPCRRGGRERTRAVAAFALDVDLGSREGGRRYPSWGVARKILAGHGPPFPFPVLVRSGSGLHAYVPLAELCETPDRETRQQAETASWALYRLLERLLAGRGYDLDETYGTERCFRVPGSWNRKRPDQPVLVRLVEPVPHPDTCPRVALEELLTWAELFGDAPREWTGELPKELPAWLRYVAECLGEGKVLEVAGEGLLGWAPKLCPACKGMQSSTPARATDTARVGILSGRLRCFRETCDAHAEAGTGEGLPLEEWLRRVPGLDVERVLELYAEAGLVEEPPVPMFPEGTPRVTLAEADDKRLLVRKVQEVLEAAGSEPGLHVLAVTPGAGKTRAALEVLGDLSHRGKPVAFFSRYHHLLDDAEAAFAGQGLTVDHVRGVGSACQYAEDFKRTGERPDWKGIVCPPCEHRERCTACHRVPHPDVILAAHASYPSLHDAGALRGRVVVIDELPDTVAREVLYDGELGPLLRPGWWPEELRDDALVVGFAVRCILEKARERRRQQTGGRKAYASTFHGKELADLLARGFLGEEELAALRKIAGSNPPRVTPADLLNPCADPRRLPHPKLPAILRAILRVREGQEEPGLAVVVKDRQAALEFRSIQPLPLPQGEGLVILDATGAISKPELEAAYGVPVHVHALEVVPERPPARVLVRSGSASRRSLCPGGEVREERLDGFLRNVLRTVAPVAPDRLKHANPPCPEGVLTHRPLALFLEEQPERLEAAARAAGLGTATARVGYYGRDDAGTNDFDDLEVGLLLTLGDPIPDLGAVKLDAAVLGMDWQELLRRRSARDLAQAVGRARQLRHPERLVVHVGRLRPPGWEDVEALRLPVGRPEDAGLAVLEALVAERLEAGEVVLPGRLPITAETANRNTRPEHVLAVSAEIPRRPRRRLREVCQRAAEALGARRGRLEARGRPAFYYPAGMPPEEAEARAWAIYHGQEEVLGPVQEALEPVLEVSRKLQGMLRETAKPAQDRPEPVLGALPAPVAVLPPETLEGMAPAVRFAEAVGRWARDLPSCSRASEAAARWARRHAVPPAVLAGLEGLAREARSRGRGGPGPP